MMTTAVGMRCRDCARARPSVTYETNAGIMVRALAAGLVAALAIGAAWGLLNTIGLGPRPRYDWSFWYALLLGFGVAESVSWAANRKRGRRLQLLAIGCVLLGVAISRVLLNARALRPVSLDAFLEQPVLVARLLGLDIAGLLFVALACAIAYVRFR